MRALALALTVALSGAAIPPTPTRWITDHAGVVSEPTRARVDARLEAYEHATGHQVVVWIDQTLGGEPIEDWAVKAFTAWHLGRKGKDDGVAIFMFVADRKLWITVGYGLEDKLPDAYASRIVRDLMVPALQKGQYDDAITGAVDQVISRLGDEPNGVIAPRLPESRAGPSLFAIIAIIVVILLLGGFAITHPALALYLLDVIMQMSRGGGGGWGGGGWGGGDGGGGFSGGGGRTGGGGAGGSW